MTLAPGDRCECYYPVCSVGHSKEVTPDMTLVCDEPAVMLLYRVDMTDLTGTAFCQGCAQYALDSGLFTAEETKTYKSDPILRQWEQR